MGAVVVLFVLATSIWVLIDAGQRDFSQNSFAKSPLIWFFGCLFLWIVVFPIYLIHRGRTPLKGARNTAALAHVPPPAASPTTTLKRCPDCAETILADARVCKHCGFRFAPPVGETASA
jgi:hypothetical protein